LTRSKKELQKKYGLGLFVGRFQPFHKGHLHAIKSACSFCEKMVIGIGSSKEKGTETNPLSSRMRIRLIKKGLYGYVNLRHLTFIEIPDFNDDEKWFRYIIGREPGIEVVFSHNDVVRKIFTERGIAVVSPPWYRRNKLSATAIRKLIRNNGKWKNRVPKNIVNNISKLRI
jgi:nicotinamide-nucleotide adenylyltransferase